MILRWLLFVLVGLQSVDLYARNTCAQVYSEPYYWRGTRQPAPTGYEIFLLGDGAFGRVLRMIDLANQKSVVQKIYQEASQAHQDFYALKFLINFLKAYGIQGVEVVNPYGLSNNTYFLPDTKGTTLAKSFGHPNQLPNGPIKTSARERLVMWQWVLEDVFRESHYDVEISSFNLLSRRQYFLDVFVRLPKEEQPLYGDLPAVAIRILEKNVVVRREDQALVLIDPR